MNKLATLLLMITVNVSAIADDSVTIHNGYITGQQYLNSTDSERSYYVIGLVDGLLLSPFFDASQSRISFLAKCLEKVTSSQLDAILTKKLNEQPEIWHQPAHTIMYKALYKMCPEANVN